MTTLWIGDFRAKPLQYTIEAERDGANFLIEDFADSAWLASNIRSALSQLTVFSANIVILLGFNDCAYSCACKALNIDNIAKSYADTLNAIEAEYQNLYFYVSAVAPVEANYPFAKAPDGSINKETLNNQISKFNKTLKKLLDVSFIDTYTYLTDTGFGTHDGSRFIIDSASCIYNFITSQFNWVVISGTSTGPVNDPSENPSENPSDNPSVGAFTPRTEAPKPGEESFIYYKNYLKGGYNYFAERNTVEGYKNVGSTLPNCTAYAWGRLYEITGVEPKIFRGNAEEWFAADRSLDSDWDTMAKNGTRYDGYERGKDPRPGAIICWAKGKIGNDPSVTGDDAGHVAIVEQVCADGSIITTESGYSMTIAWYTKRRYKGTDGNWGQASPYKFQGFIYGTSSEKSKSVARTPTATDNITKADVVSKKGVLNMAEMEINARYIWNYLGSKDWTLNAVAGMLGNMEHESSINPSRQESLGSGYGLVQWTPGSKLTNWLNSKGLPNDIDSQLERLIWERDNNQEYYKNRYKYTFKEFAKSTDSPYTLACAFAFDYERSGVALWGFHTKNHGAYCGRAKFSIACRACYAAKYGEAATKAQGEANQEALRKKRGGSADAWYKFLLPYAPTYTPDPGYTAIDTVQEPKFTVANFKLDEVNPTDFKASFIVNKGSAGSYKLYSASGKEIAKGNLNSAINSDTLKTVIFRYSKLVPNTSYMLAIEIIGKTGGEKREASITFKTPQDYPGLIKDIKLEAADIKKPITPDSTFKATLAPVDYWGYWKKNEQRYELHLIVNGKSIATKEVSPMYSYTFIIKDFKKTVSASDTIQLGVKTFVKDDSGSKVYGGGYIIASNPISFIAAPTKLYLNI